MKKIYDGNRASRVMQALKNPYLLRNAILAAAVVTFYLTVGCPLKRLFGIPCPGCGMTRAVLAMLRLDIRAAIRFHPMVLALPPAAAVYLFRKHIPKKVTIFLAVMFFTALFAVYIFRLIGKSEIVMFDFCNSIIYKLFKIFKSRERGW